MWNRTLEFWDATSVVLMWVAAITAAVAAIAGLGGALVAREVAIRTQRESDEKIAAANAAGEQARKLAAESIERAKSSELKLLQLKLQVAPRELKREATRQSGSPFASWAEFRSGQVLPQLFKAIGRAEVAQVNLPVGVLIWVMIIPPTLVKSDFAAMTQIKSHWRGIDVTLTKRLSGVRN